MPTANVGPLFDDQDGCEWVNVSSGTSTHISDR